MYMNEGNSLSDYYCYNIPVSAPLEGEVVRVIDGIPNNKIGDINIEKNWGNTIIFKHKYDLFSAISHLEADTIKVKEGDKVKKGDIVANCGNSGRSPIPHIHFQFQVTDKLGDSTHKFPFAHFLQRENKVWVLKSFEYPDQGKLIQNLGSHKIIKKAFDFKLNSKFKYQVTSNGKTYEESWEVKININNEMYIQSSTGDSATLYIAGKVFYFTAYSGKKNSALYYFYLLAFKVPLCFNNNLIWRDSYSIAQLPTGFIRYISEFFLMFKDFIKADAEFNFEESPENTEDYVVANKIQIIGEFPFNFFKKDFNGKIFIDEEGNIKEFFFNEGEKEIFSAKIILT
jgi:hypothetical protein